MNAESDSPHSAPSLSMHGVDLLEHALHASAVQLGLEGALGVCAHV